MMTVAGDADVVHQAASYAMVLLMNPVRISLLPSCSKLYIVSECHFLVRWIENWGDQCSVLSDK